MFTKKSLGATIRFVWTLLKFAAHHEKVELEHTNAEHLDNRNKFSATLTSPSGCKVFAFWYSVGNKFLILFGSSLKIKILLLCPSKFWRYSSAFK